MQVTLQMIEDKEFKIANKGYDPEEVDNFLNDIMDEMERQQNEIQALQQQLMAAKAAQQNPSAYANPAAANVPAADFKEILEMAQRVKSETIAKAQTEAAEIRSKAEEEAAKRLNGLSEEHDRLQQEVASLKKVAADYRANFEALLAEQQQALEKASGLF